MGLTCVLPTLNASMQHGATGFLTPTRAQGKSAWEANSSLCVAGRAGRAAGSVRLRATRLHPRGTVSWHFSGAWHKVRHAAAARQVLCDGIIHGSCPAAAPQRKVKWDHILLQRPFGGRELSGSRSGVPGFVITGKSFPFPGPHVLLHKISITPVSWSSRNNHV